MKILVALLGLFVVTGAFAEDAVDVDIEEDVTVEESISEEESVVVEETGSVVERVSCDDIKTKIADLTALVEPTEDEVAELEKLKQEQRTKCMRSASRRKASVAKKVTVEAIAAIKEAAEEVVEEVVEETVVEEIVAEEKAVEETVDATATETTDTTEAVVAPKMIKSPRMPKTMLGGAGFGRRIKKVMTEKKTVVKEPEQKVAEEETVVAEVEEVIDEEALLEKELANLEAGLCADGAKPNKFGCCAGEVFKDMGDTVFACCPQSGDSECFPPIK